MANNLTKAPIYMLVLEIVLVQLLLECALALMCDRFVDETRAVYNSSKSCVHCHLVARRHPGRDGDGSGQATRRRTIARNGDISQRNVCSSGLFIDLI